MEKKDTEENQTPFKNRSWDMEEDPFEFIDEEEMEDPKGRQKGKSSVRERKVTPVKAQSREYKKPKQTKNQIIVFESAVILVLTVILIISTLFQSRNMKRVMEAIADLTKQGITLNDEIMMLNRDVENLESFQESYLAANSGETILTYDSDGNQIRLPILPNVPKHPYDWTCLQSLYGRKNYIISGQRVSKQGIDVSSFQGVIDWQRVKEDGIEFVIIRLGYRGYGTGLSLIHI